LSRSKTAEAVREHVEALLELIEEQESEVWDHIDLKDIQPLIERLLKVYAYQVRNLDQRYIQAQGMPRPLPDNTTLTQTDAVIFIDQLLRMKEIELFEVQMWRSIG
jgi:hypothetical protein